VNHVTATTDAAPTVRVTIATAHGRITTDVRTVEYGPDQGQIDHDHLTALVRSHAISEGDRWPTRAVYTEADDVDPWTLTLYDVDSQDSIGTLTVHHGAGA
jgi:hypothetical protein